MTLKLTLTYHWYDMTASGEKLEEYRDIKESIVRMLFHWRDSGLTCTEFTQRLKAEGNLGGLWAYLKDIDAVELYRGYSNGRSIMVKPIEEISIGNAVPQWSNNWQGPVFVIRYARDL